MVTTQSTLQDTATTYPDPMIPYWATITNKLDETPGVATYSLEFQDPAFLEAYTFLPGQFNMLYLPGIGEVAISISSDPATPEVLLHTIRVAGNVTQAIERLNVGDQIGVRGPYGSAWPVESAQNGDLIFVAGGIGLAPLRPAIYHVIRNRDKFEKVTILAGARTPNDMLYHAEFDNWNEHDIEVIPTVDRAKGPWDGRVGVVPMLFYSLRPDPRHTTVFTCGPEIMMRFVAYEALARRIPKERILVSLERNMKCAVGFCGHCQYAGAFLCKEGPVFNFAQIEPFYNVEEF
ncbi:MAG: FAD/NAD(P)-binding protein [Chloroflexi bacterium]|nr:FAD/NAD(P)-binding protein [Chloroflexota bacterium]